MKNTDIYSYPDEDILINKFDCHDKEKLSELEAIVSGYALLNLQLHPINGKFDFAHLKSFIILLQAGFYKTDNLYP